MCKFKTKVNTQLFGFIIVPRTKNNRKGLVKKAHTIQEYLVSAEVQQKFKNSKLT